MTLVLRSIATAAWLGAALAADAPLPCHPTLVPCNYAEHFSGTLHWRSVTKAASPPFESVVDLAVTVAAGKATCSGTIDGHPAKGPGLIAVERGPSMEDAPNQPWYGITVSCPEPDGTLPNIDNAQIKTYPQKDTGGFVTLAGKIDGEPAEVDEVNGVTGTTRLEWSLTRPGNQRP